MPELKNKRHELFCLEIVSGKSNTQSAIGAGYSEKTAYSTANRLLKNVEIKKRIEELMEQVASEKVADAQEVMEYLTTVLRGKSRSSVLRFVGEGTQEIVEKPPDEKERLKAAELLGKRFGLYAEKIEVDADTDLHITVDYGEDNADNGSS